MSMLGNLLSISEQQLEQFILSPDLIEADIYADQAHDQSRALDLDYDQGVSQVNNWERRATGKPIRGSRRQ